MHILSGISWDNIRHAVLFDTKPRVVEMRYHQPSLDELQLGACFEVASRLTRLPRKEVQQ